MTIHRAKNYAHDSYEPSETVEHLIDPPTEGFSSASPLQFEPWPREVAEQFVDGHNPGYEIGYEFTYDSDTDKVVIETVRMEGKDFFPRD